MAAYTYRALGSEGESLTGVLEAENEDAAAVRLDELGYSVVSIQPQAEAFDPLRVVRGHLRPVRKQEIIFFTRQLAGLVRSGMALLPSLDTITQQTTNPRFRVILRDIQQTVQGGSSLSAALERYPGVFSDLFVSMVAVGETGGKLDQVLDRLARLGVQEMETQSKIQSALIYPAVLVAVAFLVVNFILVAVIPRFAMVFSASGAALPIPTRIVLGLSWVIRKFWFLGLMGFVFFAVWFRRYLSTEEGRYRFDRRLLGLPVFGALYTKIQMSRFARTLATLTSSGIAMLPALAVVEKTATNTAIRRSIERIRVRLAAGDPLVGAFKESGFFPPMAVQMIATAERSGALDKALDQIADFYDPEIETTIKNLTALLEPFMLLGMGLAVAFVALAVLLPIFNLMKVFRS